jgi:hypothetical protein
VCVHPYTGFVHDRGWLSKTRFDEHGFLRSTVVPSAAPTGPPLKVAVLGGSVAMGFFQFARVPLADGLRRSPQIAGRPVELHSYAVAGFKQPQQLMSLAYFLFLGQDLDVVINLDGFNEIVLPVHHNLSQDVFPFFPRQWPSLVERLPDLEAQSRLGELVHLRRRRSAWARAFSTRPWRYSITSNLVWQAVDRRMAVGIADAERALEAVEQDERRFSSHGPEKTYATRKEAYEDLAWAWASASLQMHRLCEGNGIRYYHFLQPNQYVPDSKHLTPEELSVAFREDHPYRGPVASGYPRLVAAGSRLTDLGVRFADLTMAFADVRETVYEDDCCHFNQRGQDILAERVAAVIVADLATRQLAP